MSGFVGCVQMNRLKAKELQGADGIVQCLNNFGVSGGTQLNDLTATSISSSGSISATNTVSGATATFSTVNADTLNLTNDVSFANVSATGNISAGGTLSSGGLATLDSLAVSNASTFSGAVSAQAVSGTDLTASGQVQGATLNVLGSSTVQDVSLTTLTASGASTLATVSATGATLTGDLQGTTATFSGAVSSDSLTVANAVSAASLTTSGQVVIGGDLTVNGTTTQINSTVKEIKDPMIQLGEDTSASVKDLGLSLKYNDGAAKEAFVGFDVSEQKFTVIAQATNSNDVISGTPGDLKVGDLECTGITLGGDITAQNLTATASTSLQDVSFTSASGASQTLTGDLNAQNVAATAEVSSASVKTATLTSDNASITVSKSLDATGFDLTAKEITISDDLNAVNAVLSGDVSGVNATLTTKAKAPTGEFETLTAAGSEISVDKPINSSQSITATSVVAPTVSASTSVSTSLANADTLDSNGAASITVSKPLAMGTNGVSSSGAFTMASATASGTVKANVLKAPTLSTDATEIAVSKPLNLGANSLTTTVDLNAGTGVFATSVSVPTITSAASEVAFSKPINAGSNNITTTGNISGTALSSTTALATTSVSTPLLTTTGTKIQVNKELDLGANVLTGTGDWTTSGKVSCAELEITSLGASSILTSAATVDTLNINGSAFVPETQTITDLTVKDIKSDANNVINLGLTGDAITITGSTIELTGTLTNNGSAISGGGTTYDATTDITAKDATFASVSTSGNVDANILKVQGSSGSKHFWATENGDNPFFAVYDGTQDAVAGNSNGEFFALGKVGVGIATPTEKLEVVGNIKCTNNILLTNANDARIISTDYLTIHSHGGVGANMEFTDNHEVFIDSDAVAFRGKSGSDYNTKVGFGTVSPTEMLDVNGWAKTNEGFKIAADVSGQADGTWQFSNTISLHSFNFGVQAPRIVAYDKLEPPHATAFPTSPTVGEVFFMEANGAQAEGLYVYKSTGWTMVG